MLSCLMKRVQGPHGDKIPILGWLRGTPLVALRGPGMGNPCHGDEFGGSNLVRELSLPSLV
jgi:hypothetical protein